MVDVVGEGVGHIGLDGEALVGGREGAGVDPITEELGGEKRVSLGAFKEQIGGVIGQRKGVLDKAMVFPGIERVELVGDDVVSLSPLAVEFGEPG